MINTTPLYWITGNIYDDAGDRNLKNLPYKMIKLIYDYMLSY